MFSFNLPLLDLKKEKCSIGDVYQFTFAVKYRLIDIGDLKAKFLKYIVEKEGKYEVEDMYYDENNNLILQAVVIKNPLPFLAVFGAIVLGTGSILYLMGLQLDKVEKIISMPAGKIITYTASFVICIVGYKILTS